MTLLIKDVGIGFC